MSYDLLGFLRNTENWRAPSFTTIMEQFGITSKNEVFRELKKLQQSGLIDENYKPYEISQDHKLF